MHASRPPLARSAERSPDHALLAAAASVRQAGSRTARAAASLDRPAASPDAADALVTVLRTRSGGNGSFHPLVARQR